MESATLQKQKNNSALIFGILVYLCRVVLFCWLILGTPLQINQNASFKTERLPIQPFAAGIRRFLINHRQD